MPQIKTPPTSAAADSVLALLTPPQGGSDFLSRWLAKSLKGGVIVGCSARGVAFFPCQGGVGGVGFLDKGRVGALREAPVSRAKAVHERGRFANPDRRRGLSLLQNPRPDTRKGTARPLDSFGPERGGSPFFHLAMRIRVSYKKSRGCPLFPFPARGLKLTARSGTVCLSRGKQPTGNPLFLFSLLFSPGP